MSQRGPWGRGTPRWSVVTAQAAVGMASMAGLPARRAMVLVGPPLAPSGPSLGLVFTLSDFFLAKLQPVLLPIRLCPAEEMEPRKMKQSGPVPPAALLRARIDAFSVRGDSAPTPPPVAPIPPGPCTTLRATVVFVRTSEPSAA